MAMSNIKKIIHCVCPLSTDGIPIPFTNHSDDELPFSPPITPKTSSPKNQTIPLTVYSPSKELFHVRSRPSWYMIHASTSLSLAGYEQSICIDSKPSKHPSIDRDLHSFVVNVLDPLFQVSPIDDPYCNISMEKMWQNYTDINLAYAEAVAKRYNPGDIVWIHDYQLLMVPHYLRQILPDAKIGLSIYANFPYWEELTHIHERKAMLESILLADHLGFQTKLDTRHFATACTRFLNMDCPPSSKQIGVFPSGIDSQLIIKSSVLERAKEIRDLFPQKQIIFCRDTHVATVLRTLAAFSQLFSRDRFLMNNLVLIHVCSTRVPASDLQAIPEIVRQINQLYGNTEFVPVHFYHQDIDREEREALMAAADLGLFLGSHPSTLTSAKEFVVSQCERHAPLIMSQNSSLVGPNSAITAVEDPSNIPALVTALHDALTLCSIDSEKRYENLYKSLIENDAISCAQLFIQTLIAHETLPLYTQKLIKAHKAAAGKRLIIVCDNDEITARNGSKSPTNTASFTKLLPYLDTLAKDATNTVYVVSGKPEQDLDQWSKLNPHAFGLGAEYGAYMKPSLAAEWKPTSTTVVTKKHTDWRKLITELFEKYVEQVLGSCIIDSKTMLTLDFNKSFDADNVSFYYKRCHEELIELVHLAAKHGQKLKIFKSRARIQVQKCSSLYSSEGYSTLLESLLETVRPSFVVCIGNINTADASAIACEEALFSTLYGHGIDRDHLYSVTMNPKKCTMANWYLKDSEELIPLFKQLSTSTE